MGEERKEGMEKEKGRMEKGECVDGRDGREGRRDKRGREKGEDGKKTKRSFIDKRTEMQWPRK